MQKKHKKLAEEEISSAEQQTKNLRELFSHLAINNVTYEGNYITLQKLSVIEMETLLSLEEEVGFTKKELLGHLFKNYNATKLVESYAHALFKEEIILDIFRFLNRKFNPNIKAFINWREEEKKGTLKL